MEKNITYRKATELTKRLKRRKLAPNTYLLWDNYNRQFEITFYDTTIITLLENGHLKFNLAVMSPTTIHRLNTLAPKGFWFWARTESCPAIVNFQEPDMPVHRAPYLQNGEYDERGRLLSMPYLAEKDAWELYQRVIKFSKSLVQALMRGEIYSPDHVWTIIPNEQYLAGLIEVIEGDNFQRAADFLCEKTPIVGNNADRPVLDILRTSSLNERVTPFFRENYKLSSPTYSKRDTVTWMNRRLEGGQLRPKYNSTEFLMLRHELKQNIATRILDKFSLSIG